MSHPEAFRATIARLKDEFAGRGIDVIAAAEARGFIFGAPLALEMNAGFVPIRKPGKLPYATIALEYQLEYGKDKLEVHTDAFGPGRRVLLIDDVLATGGTMRACRDLVQSTGAEVVACAFVLELSFLGGRARLEPGRSFQLDHLLEISNVNDAWIADRMKHIDASGIRKAFDMSKSMKDPINLSIGLPDFDVPGPVKAAAIEAIEAGHNAYTVTQGIPELRTKIQEAVDAQFGHADRQVLVTAGTSGALLAGLCCVVNPGDEVIVFDPYFVMYRHLATLAGGVSVLVETYPDFRIDVGQGRGGDDRADQVRGGQYAGQSRRALSRTADEMRALAELCRRRDVLLISDEVYRAFCYDHPFATPASWNDDVLVVDGFSKTYGMTGWRLGYAHGPVALIQEMAKLQQFSFVCAPSMAQYGGVVALDQDLTAQIDAYRRKRDMVVEALSEDFELSLPEGAFYAFPRAPWGTGTEFVAEAIRNNLLIIPGNVFSQRDSHFRISYAVDDATLRRGLEMIRSLADRRPA